MWRIAVILLAALFGALATVLVAWGCALRSQATFVASPVRASERLMSFLPADWSALRSRGANGYQINGVAASVWTGFGALVETSMIEGTWQEGGFVSDRIVVYGTIQREECGWPVRCLECARAEGAGTAASHLVGGTEIPESLRGLSPVSAAGSWMSSYRPALPVRPMWTPFALSALMYGAFLAVVLLGPQWVRRRVRAHRGRCVKCGYARGGLAPAAACPECGTVPARG
jgi:hypothetical protein